MDSTRYIHRHILLHGTSTTEKFTSTKIGRNKINLPDRNPREHLNLRLGQMYRVKEDADQLKKRRKAAGINKMEGIILAFQGEPGFDLKIDSLENRPSGIELLSVQKGETTQAAVFVQEGKLKYFIKKIEKYGSE